MQEKSLEQQRPLYMCFIDLEKAFDRVSREALWQVLGKSGCPEKFINMIRQFHDGMSGKVRLDDNLSDGFSVSCGVKQGCVMAPTLFNIFFAAVIADAVQKCDGQIHITFRTDKGIFDLSRFRAAGKCRQLKILDALYADDACFMADDPAMLQTYINHLKDACSKFGLTISATKTQILSQPPRGLPADAPKILLGDRVLGGVSQSKYLGSEIRSDNRLDSEIPLRIAKAASTFGRLDQRVWKSHDLRLQTKLRVYKALVIPILLYASETWCLYKNDIKRLDRFHMKCLRSILRLKWQDHVPNTTDQDVRYRSYTDEDANAMVRTRVQDGGL